MPNNWIKALKEYNKDNGDYWCVPRKGSKNYLKLQKKAKSYDSKPNEEEAVIKIQSFFKKVKENKEKQKEMSRLAIEKYKDLIPQSSISNMMKPNTNFQGNAEYLRKKMNEDFEKRQKEKYIAIRNSMTPVYMFNR